MAVGRHPLTDEVIAEVPGTPPVSGDASPEAQQEAPAVTPETPPTDSKSDADSDEATVETKPKKVDAQQKIIANLSYENRKQSKHIDRLMGIVEKGQETKPDTKPPKIEEFESIGDFLDARDTYRDSKKPPEKTPGEADQTHQKALLNDALDDLREAGSDKYDDFEEVVFSEGNNITPVMRDALLASDDSDMRTEIAYHLGRNPKEVKRIARLPFIRQVAEMGKLEQKLSSKPAPKRPSAAPAPIKPVGGGSTTTGEHRLEDSYETFLKKRNKELGRG